MRALSSRRKLVSLLTLTAAGTGVYTCICFYRNDEKLYKNVIMPLVHRLDGENAHRLAVLLSKYRLIPKSNYQDNDILKVETLGKIFTNPIGIAAGFDKNGEAILGLSDLGFGFIEIGSVTPQPQQGNAKPRVFRLAEHQAVINRYGFNNDGHDVIFDRIQSVKTSSEFGKILGINLGKNKTSTDAIKDYVVGVEKFGPVADYLVINISSPNTPGLRSMQNKHVLTQLLQATLTARDSLKTPNRPPLLLKLSPDLSREERSDIAQVIASKQCTVDGLIISNTSVERPKWLSANAVSAETGGLSGKPLQTISTEMIRDMYRLTKGSVPIIGVGGVLTGRDAYDKIKAGATLVQVYTGLVYEGPPFVDKIKRELVDLLTADGYGNVTEAVGKEMFPMKTM